ncbi:unnamed protein product [Cylicostephanus goldi]|uniref:Fibronectin type-III domain-containing protein n=1 Tax=Cylicostephanus goldi TaxID=71465 RepID=A0A3P6QDY5_CYLGO|nr:unnamed protein product [Cylicostephanus goldi]
MLVLYDRASANVESCCRKRGVSDFCSRALCRLTSPPGTEEIYTVFDSTQCQPLLPLIAGCIVDGRDSTACCRRNAVQEEENSCLNLCRGSSDGMGNWDDYLSCLSLNLASMYSCILSSHHSNTPTPPRHLKSVPKTNTSVKIQWSPPAEHPELVHVYKVYLLDEEKEDIVTTKHHSHIFENLRPDRSYRVYVVAQASNPSNKSVPSDILHFRTSSTDSEEPRFNSTLHLPKEAKKATLSCHLQKGISTHMIWEKKVGSIYRKVDGSRFHITTYTSEDEKFKQVLVSSLDIYDLNSSDFGTYRCHDSGSLNDYGEVRLIAYSHALEKPPKNPPETVLECCSREIFNPRCQTVCHAGSAKRGLKPGSFYPDTKNCADGFQNLLRCTLSEMNNAGCCIRAYIPYRCLGMCDSKFELTPLNSFECLRYQSKVRQCQAEVLSLRPEAVSNLRAKTENDMTVLGWDRSEKAEVYHVYHRRRRGPWKSASVKGTTSTVMNADEIVVLAVNAYGPGSANRIAFENNEWIGNYD